MIDQRLEGLIASQCSTIENQAAALKTSKLVYRVSLAKRILSNAEMLVAWVEHADTTNQSVEV